MMGKNHGHLRRDTGKYLRERDAIAGLKHNRGTQWQVGGQVVPLQTGLPADHPKHPGKRGFPLDNLDVFARQTGLGGIIEGLRKKIRASHRGGEAELQEKSQRFLAVVGAEYISESVKTKMLNEEQVRPVPSIVRVDWYWLSNTAKG